MITTKFYSARELHQYLSRARRWRTRRLYTHRQVSRTGWRAVLGEKNDASNAYDDETNSYMVMFFATLRNLKPLVMDAYRTKNSLPRKWRDSVEKRSFANPIRHSAPLCLHWSAIVPLSFHLL